MTSERVRIFDTTLRDGEQSPGCSMDLKEKVRLARKLQSLGVDIIEAGFPIASDGDFEAVKAVAAECREVTVAALCRTAEQDVLRAAEALRGAARPRIHTFVATSDIHLEYKLKKTRAEVVEMTRQAVRLARSFAPEVEFSAEDATRSDVDYLCEVFATAVAEGATILNVPDTVGYTLPSEFSQLVRAVRERVVGAREDITISVHCHNDLGLAVANSLAADRCRGEANRMYGERDRRARRQCFAGRDRHGDARARGSAALRNGHRHQSDLFDQPVALADHWLWRAAEQGDRRAQRFRARSRHPSARSDQQSAVLRDHDA